MVYGNLLIGLGAFALSEYCIDLLEIEGHQELSAFVGLATIFTYNFHRRIDHGIQPQESYSESVAWMLQNQTLSKIISTISLLGSLILLFQIDQKALWVILPISLISLFYVQRLSERKPLREIPFLKLFLIAGVWTSMVCGLALLFSNVPLDLKAILCICIFLYMLAEVLPFDLRDLKSDRNRDLKTLASYLGWKKSKILAYFFLTIANLLLFSTAPIPAALAFFISSIYLSLGIYFCRPNSKDLFYSLFLEISLILPWISHSILELLW